ncbi:MAG: hypothetical protein GY946_28935 [bacterium]|nr:hypothetical protein [bacterium]
MEDHVARTTPRRRRWVFGLVCFALGMGTMWGMQHVDVLSIFRTRADSEEELARGAFEALRDGDYDAFDAYVPKEGDFQKLIARIRERGSDRDRKKLERRIERDGDAAEAARKTRESARSRFANTIDRSRRGGLDWKNAEYAGLNHETTRMKERYGWRGGDIRFVVRSNGKTFEFELDNCTCMDGSWLIGSGVFLVRGRRAAPDPVTRLVPTRAVSEPAPASEAADPAEDVVAPPVDEAAEPRAPGR